MKEYGICNYCCRSISITKKGVLNLHGWEQLVRNKNYNGSPTGTTIERSGGYCAGAGSNKFIRLNEGGKPHPACSKCKINMSVVGNDNEDWLECPKCGRTKD